MRTNPRSLLRASTAGTPRASGRTTPALALPFAVVGLLAGWLSDGLLANPLVDVVPHRSQGPAAVVAALVGAAMGGLLSRAISARGALGARPLTWPRLGALVMVGGGITGAVVGGLEVGTGWSVLSGAVNGGLSGLAFVPVCALVVAAARRADRARHGSIVAAADRRAVWGILATALAVTTLAAALDVPLSNAGWPVSHPRAGLVMADGAAVAVVAVLLADLRALVRVGRLGSIELTPHEGRDAGLFPAVDLGLGDDVHADLGRATTAYRSRARPVALLLGSVADARAALRRALLRGAAGLSIAGAVLGAHAWSASRAAVVDYLALRCPRSTGACFHAGVLLLPRAPRLAGCDVRPPSGTGALAPDVPRAEALLRKGCEAGNRCSCEGLLHSLQRRGAAGAGAAGSGEAPSLPSWFVPRPEEPEH